MHPSIEMKKRPHSAIGTGRRRQPRQLLVVAVVGYLLVGGRLSTTKTTPYDAAVAFTTPLFSHNSLKRRTTHTLESNSMRKVWSSPAEEATQRQRRRQRDWSRLGVVTSSPPMEQSTDDDSGNGDRRDVTDVLLSYRSNIRRTANLSQEESKKPIRSLVHYLEQQQQQQTSSLATAIACTPEVVVESVLPALQIAAKWNDYRLLLRIWEATKSFCNSRSTHGHVVVNNNTSTTASITANAALPRLFGETLTCIGQTSASLSKIKNLWKSHASSSSSIPITPRETNAYLKLVLASDKPRLALNVWQTERAQGRTNAYSLALVLQALQNSIKDEDEVPNDRTTRQRVESSTSSASLNDDLTYDEDGVVSSPFQAWKTGAWQWTEAINLLEHDYLLLEELADENDDDDDTMVSTDWTNPVVTGLIQLNHRLGTVDRYHPEAALAEGIWDFFVVQESPFRLRSPDARTCTSFLNCLGKDWETAVSLLRSMQAGGKDDYSLPPPNVYAYAAALASCARAGEYKMAWDLLSEEIVQPNTVVFNTVLSALSSFRRSTRPTRAQRKEARDRLIMGLSLLSRMQDMSCVGDTVTYNTLLQIASGGVIDSNSWKHILANCTHHFAYESSLWPASERLVHTLLDQMEEAGVSRNELTYRNAISCVRSFQGVVHLLGRALQEDSITKAATIFDAALFMFAQEGDMDGIQLVLSKMIREGAKPTDETLSSVIRGLGQSGNTRSIPFLILALMGNQEAAEHLFTVHNLDLNIKRLPSLTSEHLTTAITSCLYQNDFENARRIFIHLRDRGMEPSDESLGAIARSYARLALDLGHGKNITEEAVSRAQYACKIVETLEEPPLPLMAIVTRACATVGLFQDTRRLLRTIHRGSLESRSGETFHDTRTTTGVTDDELLTGLHRAVLKSTADHGNITFALKFAEDIQTFARNCAWGRPGLLGREKPISWSEVDQEGYVLPPTVLDTDAAVAPNQGSLGMKATEWNFLLEAAAKSGHWKVCITTLQFLRPYLSAIHPQNFQDEVGCKESNAEYKSMSKGLISATKCFAMRSQYGWAVRSIEDWILWSGRRPPKLAVQFAIRILSARGRSDEVHRLLMECLQPSIQDSAREGKAYETTLFANAITALYKNGLYDAADDVFITSVSSGAIPYQLEKQINGTETRITLDLHGMNSAVAHSAVRCALQEEVITGSWNSGNLRDKHMIIVTGRGKKSALPMRPILRPEVQRMLIEEFYPPLSTTSVPGNMGALCVSSEGIYEWVEHQQQQKGVRMLAVAAVLKDFTSGNRLRQALSKAASSKSSEE